MRWLLLMLCLPFPALADTVVASRTIRAQTVLEAGDVVLAAGEVGGALSDPAQAVGQEARVTLYAGRPIRSGDLGPPAVVERNQLVPLSYVSGPLAIVTEGRALARGGIGDSVNVMNLASRSIVIGRIGADGMVRVGPNL